MDPERVAPPVSPRKFDHKFAILETVRDVMSVTIIHTQEVAYGLSSGTESGNFERPRTA